MLVGLEEDEDDVEEESVELLLVLLVLLAALAPCNTRSIPTKRRLTSRQVESADGWKSFELTLRPLEWRKPMNRPRASA